MPSLEFVLDLPGVTQRAIWEFHGDPRVLTLLTPPATKLRVLERPETPGRGARVVLEVRPFGVPIRWISSFAEWEPPVRFVDVQEKGPFASWRHEHLFADGRLVDRVTYEVPLARLGGRLVDLLFVRPELARMFAHRHAATRKALLR